MRTEDWLAQTQALDGEGRQNPKYGEACVRPWVSIRGMSFGLSRFVLCEAMFCCVIQAGLQLPCTLGCLHFLNAEIIDMCHYAWLCILSVVEIFRSGSGRNS
jgi:hypothetical protein